LNKDCVMGLFSLSQTERIQVRDCCQVGGQCDSSPSPSPRTRRRGIKDSIAHAISTRRLIFCLLSLFQRERMKVRDCFECDLQAPTRSFQGRYRVLRGLDGSKSGGCQFLIRIEIPLASDRVSRAGGNHDPNHPIRSKASGPGNRNPGHRDQSGAVAGICSLRSVDFGDGAREYVHNRSRFCGGNERSSLIDSLITAVSCEKRNYRPPHLSPLPASGGEADYNRRVFEGFKRQSNAMTEQLTAIEAIHNSILEVCNQ
jgi:hypothetical protein